MNESRQGGESDCGCGTGQVEAEVPCPVCQQRGVTVRSVTPEHTLARQARPSFDPELDHYFCENPACDVAYYNGRDDSVFRIDELKNRVTIKDDSPQTPLCYCFKVLKQQALEEIARTGTTNVFQTILAKMKPGQSCFCEKANPRGDTCSKDILAWLDAQGIRPGGGGSDEPVKPSGCCSGAAQAEKTAGGCCG